MQKAPEQTLSLILKELNQLGDPKRADRDKQYHKSSREHWGVPLPVTAQLVKRFCKGMVPSDLLSLAKALWATDLFDPMMAAGKVLSLPKLEPSSLWPILIDFLKQVDGWGLEDLLAHVAWKCILADNALIEQVETWTSHPNFWMRRAALVYTLPFAKKGHDPERMLGWASRYASDPEWFIQKAIGWWLRVLGAHNPDRVCTFLNAHWHQLKSVAKKESTRKLDRNDLVRHGRI